MKTGIELIADERTEQIEKHGISIQDDVKNNKRSQLRNGATGIIAKTNLRPSGWSEELWNKMTSKPYKERLIIAGALIAAEIDRLQLIEVETEEDKKELKW